VHDAGACRPAHSLGIIDPLLTGPLLRRAGAHHGAGHLAATSALLALASQGADQTKARVAAVPIVLDALAAAAAAHDAVGHAACVALWNLVSGSADAAAQVARHAAALSAVMGGMGRLASSQDVELEAAAAAAALAQLASTKGARLRVARAPRLVAQLALGCCRACAH
jgi:hypothetical protein